jgi:hypothetical protein
VLNAPNERHRARRLPREQRVGVELGEHSLELRRTRVERFERVPRPEFILVLVLVVVVLVVANLRKFFTAPANAPLIDAIAEPLLASAAAAPIASAV